MLILSTPFTRFVRDIREENLVCYKSWVGRIIDVTEWITVQLDNGDFYMLQDLYGYIRPVEDMSQQVFPPPRDIVHLIPGCRVIIDRLVSMRLQAKESPKKSMRECKCPVKIINYWKHYFSRQAFRLTGRSKLQPVSVSHPKPCSSTLGRVTKVISQNTKCSEWIK